MKRFLATLLAVVMVLAIAVPALADTMARRVDNIAYDLPAVTLTADKTEAYSGDTVNVTINLSGEFTATQLVLKVYYDSDSFEYANNYTNGEVASYVQSQSGLLSVGPGSDDDGSFVSFGGTIWQSGSSFSTTGTVVTLQFTVKQGAELGDHDFHIGKCEFAYLPAGETNATPVEHTESDCTVTIAERVTPVITVTADKTELAPGDTFTVTVSIDGTFEASELSFRLPFDKNLFTAGTTTPGEVMEAAEDAGFETVEISAKAAYIKIDMSDCDATALTETGVIGTVEFTVKDGVEGTYTFEAGTISFLDMDSEEIEYTTASETVTITENVEPEDVVFHAIPSKTLLQPGETFTVDFTITGTYQSHSNDWQLNFDNTVFEPVSFERGEVLIAAQNAGGTIMDEFRDSDWRVLCPMPTNPLSATGTIATLTFKVKDDAANGTYAFTPEITTFKYVVQDDQIGVAIEYTVEGAEVTIGEAEPVEFSAVPSKTELQPGDTFTVDFVISGEYEAHSMDWQLNFDNTIFEAVSFERGVVATTAAGMDGTMVSDQIRTSDFKILIIMATDPLTAEGTIATITFKVKDDAPAGTYTFTPEITTFKYVVVGDNNGVEIPYTTTPADVTVTAPAEPVVFQAVPSKTELQPGETFTVDFIISGEYEAHSMDWQLNFDNTIFEAVSFERGVVATTAAGMQGTMVSDQIRTSDFKILIIMATDPLTAEGTIATITFKVKDDAPAGTYTFTPEITTFKYVVIGDNNGVEIPYTTTPADVTVTAPATYAITWKVDGQDDVTTTVNAGEVPEYPYGTPIKQADAQYTYEFAGWTPEVVAATEDATYTAVWTPILNEYTVTWIIDDQEETETYQYGATPTHADPVKEGYTFNGWDPEIAEVTGNATYTAQFTVNKYRLTIYYLNEKTGFAMPGATAVFADIEYGAEYSYTSPEIEGYHLVDPAQTVISGTMPAQSVEIDVYYAINVYTITFVDEDGTELQTIEVEHGTTPAYTGETPTKADTQFVHYEFAGWTPNVVAATEDATYTAVYEETHAPYTVKFYVKNDVLASVNAYYLIEADIPADVNWYGYHFDGWDMTLEEINAALENGDVTVNAKFSPLASTFTVTIIYGDEVTTKDFTESRWITVKAKAEKNGQYFQYWTMNGVIISYSPRANVRVVADCELKAVYGDTQPADVTAVAQLMKATYADNRITFLFYFAAPDGATIDKAGIWACNGADYENYSQLLDADHHRFERFCSISNATEPASYTWIKTNVAEGDSWYVRPFVTYTLNGEQVTFKGEIVKITAGTDYDIGDAN